MDGFVAPRFLGHSTGARGIASIVATSLRPLVSPQLLLVRYKNENTTTSFFFFQTTRKLSKYFPPLHVLFLFITLWIVKQKEVWYFYFSYAIPPFFFPLNNFLLVLIVWSRHATPMTSVRLRHNARVKNVSSVRQGRLASPAPSRSNPNTIQFRE